MALTGLDIYKLLPKTNCKACGFATCLAFAMALAQKKVSLDKCPHITAQAREALESAAQPPIKLVTIGTGDEKIEIGNETVMYRHEQKFYHPAAIGFLIEDTFDDSKMTAAIAKINALKFERVGQEIRANLIYIANVSQAKDVFLNAVKKVVLHSKLCIALSTSSADTLQEALSICKDRRPLVICEDAPRLDECITLAKKFNVPISISCVDVDEASRLTDKTKKAGLDEIVINIKAKSLSGRVQDFTFMRRTALKKNFRPLGYPVMALTTFPDPALELAEAISYVLKYAGIVIMKNTDPDYVFPLLVARQDIYQDPQKPVQVEPKIYEIGKVTKNSPVLITTNFSITYFTVAGEVESSKVPSYIIVCDSEGMSVLTAWAAEKFTAEKIADTLKKCGIETAVSHHKIVIPGYVSVMSGKLEEVSGWAVAVGPREASGIPNYLRNLK